jgi:hypothetical protein
VVGRDAVGSTDTRTYTTQAESESTAGDLKKKKPEERKKRKKGRKSKEGFSSHPSLHLVLRM